MAGIENALSLNGYWYSYFNFSHFNRRQRSNLQSHKRSTHYDDKRYKCTDCGRAFKRRRLLDYHMKAAHTGERPYKCTICLATFIYPEHFKKHKLIHTGEKPYECEVRISFRSIRGFCGGPNLWAVDPWKTNAHNFFSSRMKYTWWFANSRTKKSRNGDYLYMHMCVKRYWVVDKC